MHHTSPPVRPTARGGLSLVEVMVALVLIAIGFLGIAGASALSLRALAANAASMRASGAAATRMASLEGAGCDAARDGALDDAAAGQSERWHLGPIRAGAILVDDTVFWYVRGRERRVVTRGALLC